MGKYSGDESTLPQREHPEGYVPFREPQSMKSLAIRLNIAAIAVMALCFYILYLRTGRFVFSDWGVLAATAAMFPHEFLHAICFKGDVYIYQNLKQGMLFVVGLEDMTKGRFLFMSLLPNIVFGFIPFLIFLINPSLSFFGTLGAVSIAMGAGDYMNVFNALTQMPSGALTYLSGMHSYWYIKG